MALCWPDGDRVNGTLVLQPNDIVFPFKTYVEDPVRLTIDHSAASDELVERVVATLAAGPMNRTSANQTTAPAIAPGRALTTSTSQVPPSMISRCPIASSPRGR